MNPFAAFFALCLLAQSQAAPGYEHWSGGSNIQLQGVPDESHYDKLTYPKLDVIDLGSSIKGHLPPAIVTISKHETVKIPQPYPVKVPYPVPHPVHIPKPYPVVETKIVKVPHPVPVEVVKKVPYPIEVPKPYPVPHEEFSGGHGGLQHLQEGGQQEGGQFESGEQHGFDGGFGGEHAQADQSAAYEAIARAQQGGWTPVQESGEEAQQQEEQH